MYKFKSFISYSRAADTRLAPELKSALQGFAKPWYKLRAIQVFCDQTNLTANPDLWGTIERSLANAEYFIYLASPQAAQSKWVKKELEAFQQMRSAQNIIIVLTDGAIAWDEGTSDFNWTQTTAFPNFERPVFAHEPTWLDLTWIRKEQLSSRDPRFLDTVASLSARLRDIDKDVLIGKDVEEHRKAKRFRTFSVLGLCLLALFLSVATVAALLSEKRSQQRLVQTFAGNGQAMLETGDYSMAIPWYIEAMQNDRDDSRSNMHQARVDNLVNEVPSLSQVWHTSMKVLKTAFVGNAKKVLIISGEPIDWFINEFTCFTNNNGICKAMIQVVDIETGKDVFKPVQTLDGLREAKVNAAGTLLATISVANLFRMYDLASGRLLWQSFLDIPASSDPSAGIIEFNKQGTAVLALTQNKLLVYDPVSGKRTGEYKTPAGGYTGYAAFLEDGNRVLIQNINIEIWNYKNNSSVKKPVSFVDEITEISLSPDYRHLAVAGYKKNKTNPSGESNRSLVSVVNIDHISEPLFSKEFNVSPVKMVFTNDGSMLAINSSLTTEGGSQDLGTAVWHTLSGEPVIQWIKMTYEVNIAFDQKGKNLILTCDDGTTQLFPVDAESSGAAAGRSVLLHDGNTGQKSTSNANDFLLTVTDQHLVKLWKLPSIENIYGALDESPPMDGNAKTFDWYMAYGSINDTIKLDSSIALIVDQKTDKQIGKPLQGKGQVYQATVSPGGELIVLQSENEVSVWQRDNQQKLYAFPVANSTGIREVSFSPDGKKILTSHFNNAARIWEAWSGKPVTPFMRHPFSTSVNDGLQVRASHDFKQVITKDINTYRVWDAGTGEPISAPIMANVDYEILLADTSVTNKTARVKAAKSRFSVRSFSPEVKKMYGELLSNHQLEETGAMVPLTTTEFVTKWDVLKKALGR